MKQAIHNFFQKIVLKSVGFPRGKYFTPPSASYDCFILGSGRSLLRLSAAEIEHINRSPFVLAFNKYLIFYEKIGIIPTHYLLADDGDKALLMFHETIPRCRHAPLDNIHFIFSEGLIKKIRKQNGSEKLFSPRVRKRSTLITRTKWLKGGKWAKRLTNRIYHFRGSLSGAINITSILNPDRPIKLLGVDLNEHAYFFQEEILSNPEKWSLFLNRLTPEAAQHETIVEVKDTGGIQEVFPFMHKNVQKNGGTLVCCNPNSYLVTEKILKFSPVIHQTAHRIFAERPLN